MKAQLEIERLWYSTKIKSGPKTVLENGATLEGGAIIFLNNHVLGVFS